MKALLPVVLLSAGVACRAFGANPFLPLWEFIPDGEPYVFDDPDHPGEKRVYLYGSHDIRQSAYCGRDQVVWSASVNDLNNWRCDGVSFRSLNDANGRPLSKTNDGDVLFAPDVAVTKDANGKPTYWLYPNTQAWGRNGQIAKSDRPDGPFTVCNWMPGKPTETTGILRFDPAVFVDDDGRVYGYWGFCRSYAAELDPTTMCTAKPGTKVVEDMVSGRDQSGVFRFFEASSIRKIKDKYVFIYSRWTKPGDFGLPGSNYTLAYAYSESPLGPWTYGGTLIDGRGRETAPDGTTRITATPTGNTHGSLCEINGQWWVFYHRQSGTDEFSRQAMVAPVSVTVEPGKGGKVVITEGEYTSEGFETEGLDPRVPHVAGIACHYTGPRPARQQYPRVVYPGPYFRPFRGDFYDEKDLYGEKVNRSDAVHITDGSTLGYKYFNFGKRPDGDIGPYQALEITYVPMGVPGTMTVWAKRPSAAEGGVKLGEFAFTAEGAGAVKTATISLSGTEALSGKVALYFTFASDVKDVSICELRSFVFLHPAGNPLFTDAFTADPAPIVDGDTCYVITTQDENDGTPGQWLIMNKWRAYSSKDMKNWKYHGVIMDWHTYSWGASDSWASQVVKGADGMFYHYTTLVGRGDLGYGCRCTGVAVSDTPIGPWKDAIGKPLIVDKDTPSPYGWDDIDPTVFIDDDGTPWMAWGNPVCYLAKLKKNMIELDGEIRTLALPNYTEGPWLFKRNGLYYLLYVSHNHLGYGEKVSYATATSMDGVWIHRGLLCENPGHDSFGIHPGVCEFKGQWYFFYFNDRLQLPNNGLHGNSNRRSVAAEYMYFNPDGSIRPIVMTKEGLAADPLKSGRGRAPSRPAAAPRSSTWKSFDEMRALTWNNPASVQLATGKSLYYDFPEYKTHRQGAGAETLGQTFTPAEDMTLRKLALFVGNGDGTDETGPLTLTLKERTSGKVLAERTFGYEPDFRKPLEFAFDGAARPQLKAGVEYVVELAAPRKTSPIVWFISRKDVFPGGVALQDGHPITDKEGHTFDFGLALY